MTDLTKSCYNNDICRECIEKNIKKYGSFDISCSGITVEEDVKFAIKNGASEHEARWLFDAVYFFESIFDSKVRWYQKRILQCTARRLTGRQCRQTGKSLIYLYKILHTVLTTEDTSVLIVAPTEKQIAEMWNKYIYKQFIHKSDVIKASVVSSAKSPAYEIAFDNGSRITLSIANDSCRGWTGSILYVDEASTIPSDALSSIIMTIGSAGSNSYIYSTSTPRGRGNFFYKSCKESSEINEFHVSIYEVEEMKSEIENFRKILGETSFMQECEAEFPDAAGGPFNYKGIDLAKSPYEYEECVKENGYLYFGGVDWNGPNVGTYFYVFGFNPDTGQIKAVDKKIVSSAVWNSLAAKQNFIDLNRKWNPKTWMVDYGFCLDPNSIIETDNGIRKLSEISVGDKVLTHAGNFRAVTKIMKPLHEKDVYKLSPVKHEPIYASGEHKFLIFRDEKRYKTKKKNIEDCLFWEKTENINPKTDFLVIPKRKEKETKQKHIIDLYEFLKDDYSDLVCDEKHIWQKNSFYTKMEGKYSLAELCKITGNPKITLSRITRKLREKKSLNDYQQSIYDEYKQYLDNILPNIKIKRHLDILDEDFLFLAGFWLAEGWNAPNAIAFCQADFQIEEKKFNKTVECAKKVFPELNIEIYKELIGSNLIGNRERKNPKTKHMYTCYVFGKIISILFEKLFGKYCDKKFIHPDLLKYKTKLGKLLAGFIYGDGSRGTYDNSPRMSFNITGITLAYNFRDILIANGIVPYVKNLGPRNTSGHKTAKEQIVLTVAGEQEVISLLSKLTDIEFENPERVNRRKHIETKNYYIIGINSNKFSHKTDNLLDIEVEVDHSFTVNGIVCHNSASICEDLKLFSIRAEQDGMLPHNHPDCMIKYTLEPVQFGGWVEVEDPFSREINKKTTRGFMVAEISKLFEPMHDETYVPISFPASDVDLIESLENYKLINTTSKGTDQYGFEKGSGIEDHCYTPGHELLTRDGWKKIEDITLDDEVAAPNKFGKLKYEKPSRIINKEYEGKIYKVNTRGISFEVTNKHRLPYIPVKKYFNKEWEIQSEPIDELTPYLLKTPAAALEYNRQEYAILDEEIYLLGMFLAEGCTNINHHHYRTIWDQKDEENIIKIRNAIKVVYPSIYSERVNKIGVTRFEIQKMIIYNKYKKYGKAHQKYIDREYLDKFSKRQLKILWDGLMDGDGHYEFGPHGGSHYDTISLQLANDFQELCVKLGMKTTFQKLKIPTDKGPRQQSYRIGIHRSEPFHTYTKKSFNISNYSGMVHCVTVTDGLLIVRHNGKVHIGSNCMDAHNLALYGIVKHYSELFKRIIAPSSPIYAKDIFNPMKDTDENLNIHHSQSIILLTDNSPDPISLDERSLKKYEPDEPENLFPIISRTFNKSIDRRKLSSKRNNYIVNRLLPF